MTMVKLSFLLALATSAAFACSSPATEDPVPPLLPPPTTTGAQAPPPVADDAGALRLTCPKKAPFDTSIPGLVEQCTTRVLIAGLDRAVLKLSRDDGATWTDGAIDPAMPDAQSFNFATGYGVVAAMTRGGIYTSTDVKTWTRIPFAAGYNFNGAVTFADGRFASGGTGGTFGSADGVVWTGYRALERYPSGAVAGVDTFAVAFLGSQWILAGRAENKGIVRTSKDGLAWSESTNIGPQRSGAYSVASTKDHGVVVGAAGAETEGVIARTTDGTVWADAVDKALGLRFVVSDGKRLVGFGQNRTLTSTDGVAWTKLGDAPNLDGAVFAENLWFGRNESVYFVSADAVTWKAVLTPGGGNYLGSVGFARILK